MSSPNRTRKPISHPSTSSREWKHVARHRKEFFNQQGRSLISFRRVTIGSLPDNVLLDIFDFCQLVGYPYHRWLRLVHICRRWRSVVFASPHRLGLKILCQATSPMREILEVWPPVQIFIQDSQPIHHDGDNIIAALKHPDRVRRVGLSGLTGSLLERLAAVMQEPFPVLTNLDLHCDGQTPPVLPDTFLGGSAPLLRSLWLYGIPFPALPKPLLSARYLVSLRLLSVPHTGYISPEAMVTCLSALTNLKSLTLKFQSPSSCSDQGSQRPLVLTRVDLSALTELEFQGVSEYLEDFLVRINTPVITTTTITFFNRVIFDIPQLFEFVSRTKALRSGERAELFLNEHFASLFVHRSGSPPGKYGVWVRCDAYDWKISFLEQICSQLLPLLSSVGRLYIEFSIIDALDEQDVDHTQWLEIFRPFIAVQSLDIRGTDGLIAPALQELTGARVMEVLPALRGIFVSSGSVWKAIGPFITARQLSNHPVTVHYQGRVPLDEDF